MPKHKKKAPEKSEAFFIDPIIRREGSLQG